MLKEELDAVFDSSEKMKSQFKEMSNLVEMPRVPKMVIAVDFDGTLVRHEFPEIGKVVGEAFFWLRTFKDFGASLILYTMRDKEYLQQALDFCKEQGIEFDCHSTNPTQSQWTTSPKCYAHLYIDDAAFGCPLVWEEGKSPYADWSRIGPKVVEMIQAFKEGKDYYATILQRV